MDKIMSEGLYDKLLYSSLESVEIVQINTLAGKIETVYKKDDKVQAFVISYSISFDSFYKCYFKFSTTPLEESMFNGTELILGIEKVHEKQTHPLLDEIAYIHTTSYTNHYYDDKNCKKQMQCESLAIVATTKEGKLKEFTLCFKQDKEDNRVFNITSRVLENQFYTKSLRRKDNLVVSLHFDKNYISRYLITDSINDDGGISRLHTPLYTDTLKKNSKSKICLVEEDEHFHIEGMEFSIMDKEHYALMDYEDKALFHKFVDEAVVFLGNLFINKTFKNAYSLTFESDEKYENFIESLKNKDYTIEKMYSNAEMARPASLEIFRVFKKEEELKMVIANDWLGEYEVSLEYNKDI